MNLAGCVAPDDLLPLGEHERANVDPGQRVKQPENIQQPQNHGDDDDAVQNGLDGALHGDEAIHQPQEYAHHDENFQELN
jgi:hypothetical protein